MVDKKNPNAFCGLRRALWCALLFGAVLLHGEAGFGQVSPVEILNPDLKAAEEKYLPQLKALNHSIAAAKFPFPFLLSRYVGLDPAQQIETDSRGLEFVRFHSQVVLKISGNYNAAYNADLLTDNERAGRTFQDVIVPILGFVTREIPQDVTCDAIGFEISYHARRPNPSHDYEGKEILVVVFEKSEGFGFVQLASDSERQDILNRSEIYLNGAEFGLALGERKALNVEALPRSASNKDGERSSAPGSSGGARLGTPPPDPLSGRGKLDTNGAPGLGRVAPRSTSVSPGQPETRPAPEKVNPADLEALQKKYKSHLDALAKLGAEKFNFVDYAPPSLVLFHNRLVLQITLRNPRRYAADSTSIYKRAAQSFDLFLASKLKDLLEKVPPEMEIDGVDATVLHQFVSRAAGSSEAVEFICPIKLLRQFVEAEITNQELLNQSVVLVNGERIALNLQQVE